MQPILRRLTAFEAHHHFFVALLLGGGAFAIASGFADVPVRIVAAWDAFAVTATALAWTRIFFTNARTAEHTAKLDDSSRRVLFLVVIGAALASLFAVGALLIAAKDLSGSRAAGHVILAASTVICSWLLVHTFFTLRYAHLFYRHTRGKPADTPGSGLDFPEEKHPDFLDFAYFSFVVGMTCQVSDVQITARAIRRTALLHGLLAFVFNTVILALCLNLASSLL